LDQLGNYFSDYLVCNETQNCLTPYNEEKLHCYNYLKQYHYFGIYYNYCNIKILI